MFTEITIQVRTKEDILVTVDTTEVVTAPLNKIEKNANYVALELDTDGMIILPKELSNRIITCG